jgi:hypothetical protein
MFKYNGPWTANETTSIEYLGHTQNVGVMYRSDNVGVDPVAFIVSGDQQTTSLLEAAPDMAYALIKVMEWLKDAEDELCGPIGLAYRANMHKPVVLATMLAAMRKAGIK